jgi:hypothetical protein
VRIPGQGSRDLPKDARICKIIEKRYVNDSIANTAPQLDAENVTIHDNFRLINVMFLDEVIEMSDQCGSLATRSELDTSQVGANSPFWVYVSNKFNSIAQDGDPNVEGIDYLDHVQFTYPFNDSHSVTIDPGKHNFFSGTKLRTMWNKIKGDYDLAMMNFTKSGNHNSSFTATAIRRMARLQRGENIDDDNVSCTDSEIGMMILKE